MGRLDSILLPDTDLSPTVTLATTWNTYVAPLTKPSIMTDFSDDDTTLLISWSGLCILLVCL